MSRVTQGVRLINLKENSVVSSVSIVDKEETDDNIDSESLVEESNNIDIVVDTVVEDNNSNESDS